MSRHAVNQSVFSAVEGSFLAMSDAITWDVRDLPPNSKVSGPSFNKSRSSRYNIL